MRSHFQQGFAAKKDKRAAKPRGPFRAYSGNKRKPPPKSVGTEMSTLPGFKRTYARRLCADGITSVDMLMSKMDDFKDPFCFRNWLVRITGLTNQEARAWHKCLKFWAKAEKRSRRSAPVNDAPCTCCPTCEQDIRVHRENMDDDEDYDDYDDNDDNDDNFDN